MLVAMSLCANEWLILNRNIGVRWQLLKPFNCVEIIAIRMCKQISSNLFKNEIIYKQRAEKITDC